MVCSVATIPQTSEPSRLEPGVNPETPILHLASQSARRRDLLTRHGIAHHASHPGIDDGLLHPGKVPPEHWVAALAYLKAAAGVPLSNHLPVLGADTVCVKHGQIIGQPSDADDARRILRLLENGSHHVITGVALVWPGSSRREIFTDRAEVHVGDIGDDRIEDYIKSGQWQGKAGAYNLAERLEAGWPIRCDGDPTTVMGLPMRALLPRLARWRATVA